MCDLEEPVILIFLRHGADSINPFGMLVEAGYKREAFSSGGQKQLPSANADFFRSLKAVGDKGRAENDKPAFPFAGETDEFLIRGGLDPFVSA